MNVERLHTIAMALMSEMASSDVSAKLNAVVAALENIVANPSAPQHQQELSAQLGSPREVLGVAESNAFSPGWRRTMEELGIADLFGDGVLNQIDDIIERNQLTPSVAVEEMRPIVSEVQETEKQLQALVGGLRHFEVETEELHPGEVGVSVLIPRQAVDNDLPDLGRELIKLQRLLGPFLELTTGSLPDLKVRAISSSDFGINLDMGVKTATYVAAATAYVINTYGGILDIRVKRNELSKQGVPDDIIGRLTEHVEARMASAIATSMNFSKVRTSEGASTN